MTLEETLRDMAIHLPEGISEGVALGTGLADGYLVTESPIGNVAVSFNTRGVSSVDLADPGFATRFQARHGRTLIAADMPASWGRHLGPALEAGQPGRLPVDLQSVTSFQQTVLLETARIPKGQVRSYGWLARRIDNPGATRAVGTTMASNPVPLIIPCHRVVRADGHIGAYSLGGPHNKRVLLDAEGADTDFLEDLAERGVRFIGHRGTRVFCLPTCSRLEGVVAERTEELRNPGQAEARGYRACRVCRPLG